MAEQSCSLQCESVGIKIPAHYDTELGKFVLDYEAPIRLDEETRTWDYNDTMSWEEQLKIWKRGSKHKVPSITDVQTESWGTELWQDLVKCQIQNIKS